jgi:hypothetical protein
MSKKIVTINTPNKNTNLINENKRVLSSSLSSSSSSQSPNATNSKKTKLFFIPNRFSLLSTDASTTADNNIAETDDQAGCLKSEVIKYH